MMLMISIANDVDCVERTTTGGCSWLLCTIRNEEADQERYKFLEIICWVKHPVKTAITTVFRQALSGIFGGISPKHQDLAP
jgi:hypothetical protein